MILIAVFTNPISKRNWACHLKGIGFVLLNLNKNNFLKPERTGVLSPQYFN